MSAWIHIDGRPYEGETWECSECGYEITLTEDRDLPEVCPECGK